MELLLLLSLHSFITAYSLFHPCLCIILPLLRVTLGMQQMRDELRKYLQHAATKVKPAEYMHVPDRDQTGSEAYACPAPASMRV